MLNKLIGSQVLKVEKDCIIVKKDDKVFQLDILDFNGDCCGYAKFKTQFLYSENDNRNPIITNITHEREDGYGETSLVTFYGESKEIATIESEAGSGSGWLYGASVSIVCKELEIDEILVEW